LIITGIEGGECGWGLVMVWINNVGDLRSMPSAGQETSAIKGSNLNNMNMNFTQ